MSEEQTLTMEEPQNTEVLSEEEQDSLRVGCLLYTSDAADDLLCVDLGGRRIIKKKYI